MLDFSTIDSAFKSFKEDQKEQQGILSLIDGYEARAADDTVGDAERIAILATELLKWDQQHRVAEENDDSFPTTLAFGLYLASKCLERKDLESVGDNNSVRLEVVNPSFDPLVEALSVACKDNLEHSNPTIQNLVKKATEASARYWTVAQRLEFCKENAIDGDKDAGIFPTVEKVAENA